MKTFDPRPLQPLRHLSAAALVVAACGVGLVALGAAAITARASVITRTTIDGVIHGFNDRVVRIITPSGMMIVPRAAIPKGFKLQAERWVSIPIKDFSKVKFVSNSMSDKRYTSGLRR